MHQRPIKTYGKKPISYIPFSSRFTIKEKLDIFDLSKPDDTSILRENDKSTGSNQFESTFDRIAKDAKLPPLPSDYNLNNPIVYISSSSSSSLSDENWVRNVEISPKTSPKKTINRKRRKKVGVKKKKYIEKIKVDKTSNNNNNNRKRQNNLQNMNTEQVANVELIPPQRKTRRAVKEHVTAEHNLILDESNVALTSVNPSPAAKYLKSCCVPLPRLTITDCDPTNETSHLSIHSDENINYSLHSPVRKEVSAMLSINQEDNTFSSIKDCRIVLSRMEVNSEKCNIHDESNSKTTVSSSTPLTRHVVPLNLRTEFSPISNNCRNNKLNIIKSDEFRKICDTDDGEPNETKAKNESLSEDIKVQDSFMINSFISDDRSKQSLFDTDYSIDRNDDFKESFGTKHEFETNPELFEENSIKSELSYNKQTIDSRQLIQTTIMTSSRSEIQTSNKDTSEESYHLAISNASSDKSNLTIDSVECADDKTVNSNNSGDSSEQQTKINHEISTSNTAEPFVLLTRLHDPVQITTKRAKYSGWARQLDIISESSGRRISNIVPLNKNSSLAKLNSDEKSKSSNRFSMAIKTPHLSRRTRSVVQTEHRKSEHNKIFDNMTSNNLYLQSGKSWTRSLSILNRINNNDDIEKLSIGKGKKWRQSVLNIFDMQSQGALQSCLKSNDNKNDKNAGLNDLHKNNVTRNSSSTVTGTLESISPGRFVRRVSVRVVPDKKYSSIESKDVKDTSFFEVYGIPTNKNRKSFENTSKSTASRNTYVYNLRCPNVEIEATSREPVTARSVVLERCGQTDSVPFKECYPETFLDHCRKIGEGVYGEVFLYENKKDKSVIKIIPIEGEKLVNGEPQKKFSEILSEIIISMELHNLRCHDIFRTNGFVEVKNIRCIIGKYPQKLIEHWQTYDEEKASDNDCPIIFNDDQLYIALELGHGGQDLEAFVFQNAAEAYSSFVQAALSLAVAEKSLDFEHRDLHWGNLLISRTDDNEMTYKLDTEEIIFPCNGLKVSIIDFTLSRMSYQGCCIFNDLSLDPALFTAAGEYQFEIYRLMKAKIRNNWQLFEPYTNVLWLHYLIDKMITVVRYKKKTTKIHKNAILKMQELKEILLDYDSAYDFITNCNKLSNLQRKKTDSS